MNIVYLDTYTINPGDLGWENLEKLGNLSTYPRTVEEQVIERSIEADCILTNKVVFSKEVIKKLPKLKYIGVTATGYNIIDIPYANEKGIIVTNIPEYGTKAVAQHTFALILALTNKIVEHHNSVKKLDWVKATDWTYTLSPLQELEEKILGIAGMGRIGEATANIGKAFGMKVIFYNRSSKNITGFEQVSKELLFKESDILSLHLPLNNDSEKFINAQTLALMKKNALMINTSRGALIDESATAEALKNGQIAGLGVDVLSQEPPPKENPLLYTPNTIITPHNAWIAKETRQRLLDISTKNLANFIKGNPQNVVSS